MHFSPESDEVLVKRLIPGQSGNLADRDQAWADLDANCREALRRFIRQWMPSEAEAEEIYQDTLITAFCNLQQGRYVYEGKPIVAYLKAIARYKILAERRRMNRWVELDDDLFSDDRQRPESMVESRQEWDAVLEAIDGLPDKQRRVILGLAAGKDHSELADEFDMTEEAIRQNKSRGLRAVQERVA
jgi:RNA polymerase sigma-70 factor, ECF subfamily